MKPCVSSRSRCKVSAPPQVCSVSPGVQGVLFTPQRRQPPGSSAPWHVTPYASPLSPRERTDPSLGISSPQPAVLVSQPTTPAYTPRPASAPPLHLHPYPPTWPPALGRPAPSPHLKPDLGNVGCSRRRGEGLPQSQASRETDVWRGSPNSPAQVLKTTGPRASWQSPGGSRTLGSGKREPEAAGGPKGETADKQGLLVPGRTPGRSALGPGNCPAVPGPEASTSQGSGQWPVLSDLRVSGRGPHNEQGRAPGPLRALPSQDLAPGTSVSPSATWEGRGSDTPTMGKIRTGWGMTLGGGAA